jgi:hypothetical protein
MGVDRTFTPRGLGESLSFFFTGLFNIVLPSLVGGPWGAADNTTSIYDPMPAVLWLPMLALAVCAAILVVRHRRRGGWLIGMVLTYAVVSWGLVLFSSRYQSIGVLSVREASATPPTSSRSSSSRWSSPSPALGSKAATATTPLRRPLPAVVTGRVDALGRVAHRRGLVVGAGRQRRRVAADRTALPETVGEHDRARRDRRRSAVAL